MLRNPQSSKRASYLAPLLLAIVSALYFYIASTRTSSPTSEAQKMSSDSANKPVFTGQKPIIVKASAKHLSTIIFSHGLGDTADGWLDFAEDLAPRFPHVKWILTNAPKRYIRLFDQNMPSWWNFKVRNGQPKDEDQESMLESVATIQQLIEIEIAEGIPEERIAIGGFSQGCILSLLVTIASNRKLAGTLALSGYLALTHEDRIDTMATDIGRSIPIFWAHGDKDAVISLEKNQIGYNRLTQKMNFQKIDRRIYKGLAHSLGQQETVDIVKFLETVLP